MATEPQTYADPIAAWHAALEEKMAKGMTRAAAISKTVAQQPELHRQYVAEYNRQHNPAAAARSARGF
jgi:hypothetical protein